MKKVDIKQINKIRRKHNSEILKRMQSGDSLKSYESSASWFPPRPVIQKDPKAIEKLYKSKSKDSVEENSTPVLKEVELKIADTSDLDHVLKSS